MEDTTHAAFIHSYKSALSLRKQWRKGIPDGTPLVVRKAGCESPRFQQAVPSLVTQIAFRVTHSPPINEREACGHGESRVAIFLSLSLSSLFSLSLRSERCIRVKVSRSPSRNYIPQHIAPADYYPTRSRHRERIHFAYRIPRGQRRNQCSGRDTIARNSFVRQRGKSPWPLNTPAEIPTQGTRRDGLNGLVHSARVAGDEGEGSKGERAKIPDPSLAHCNDILFEEPEPQAEAQSGARTYTRVWTIQHGEKFAFLNTCARPCAPRSRRKSCGKFTPMGFPSR